MRACNLRFIIEVPNISLPHLEAWSHIKAWSEKITFEQLLVLVECVAGQHVPLIKPCTSGHVPVVMLVHTAVNDIHKVTNRGTYVAGTMYSFPPAFWG